MQFFTILYRANEDIKKLKKVENLEEYAHVATKLEDYFIQNNLWGNKWQIFSSEIQNKNVLLVLKSLAQDFSDEYPEVSLSEEFLQELKLEFNRILEEIKNSDLILELKLFLIQSIEEILIAIERYHNYGAKDIEIVVQSTIWKLYKEQNNISEEDREKPIWKRTLSAIFSLESLLSMWIATETFLVPKFEDYTQRREKAEEMFGNATDLRDVSDSIGNFRALSPANVETLKPEKPTED